MPAVTTFNYVKSQKTWDSFLQNNGAPAVLRRAGIPDRPCWAAITDYTPMERLGKLFNPTDRRVYLSALMRQAKTYHGPPVTLIKPDSELDVIVFYQMPLPRFSAPVEEAPLHIYSPIGQIGPANVPVLWDLRVRR